MIRQFPDMVTLQLPFIAPQRVKPVAGQAEVARVPCLIEMRQHIADPSRLIGPHPARIVVLEQAFQPPVTKRL
jgi:hypothetical protein